MNRATLTSLYLDEVSRSGVTARELVGKQAQSERHNAFYHGRYLPRPLFLGYDECHQIYTDLETLRSALASLPDRLFGGNLAAFGRAVGMTEIQISAILRCPSTTVTKQARSDMYIDETGAFKLLELNIGSALGGMDSSDLCAALLEHPLLHKFAEVHRLEYADTLRERANNVFAETGLEPGSRPMVAITDWPSSFATLGPYIHHATAQFTEDGFDAHACHIGQLEVRDEGVWLGDRRVDIIYRLFMIEDLLEYPDAPALMDPILDAVARGWVKIFTPLDTDAYASKSALAMLSDEENRSLFDPDELTSLDRILPWTRAMRPGPVTLEDGRRVDLLDYVLSHRRDLALKPTLLHGGSGVLLGWRADVSAETWEERIRAAMEGPYVIQRRVRPVPELFPGEDGRLVPFIVNWGVYTMVNGYGGVHARATTVGSDVEVIAISNGAFSGGCLHAQPDSE